MEKYEAEYGTVILMEVKTGAIKAISNLGITSNNKYFEKLNYAVGTTQEPGSTFKLTLDPGHLPFSALIKFNLLLYSTISSGFSKKLSIHNVG